MEKLNAHMKHAWQRLKCALGFHGEGVELTYFVAESVRREARREVMGCRHCPALWLGNRLPSEGAPHA